MCQLYLQENDDADSRGVTLEEAVVDDSLEVVVDYSYESKYQRKQAWKQKQCLMLYISLNSAKRLQVL